MKNIVVEAMPQRYNNTNAVLGVIKNKISIQ